MKQIYILRHAQKNSVGNLTDEGIQETTLLRNLLPKFKIVIASDSPRTRKTAKLLTGLSPHIDSRARYFNAPKKINDEINKQAILNPNGFIGAYLSNKEIKEEVAIKAKGLVELVFETLEKLNFEEKALIVSHEITMVPAIKLFTKNYNIQSFNYLSGYIVDEDRNLILFSK